MKIKKVKWKFIGRFLPIKWTEWKLECQSENNKEEFEHLGNDKDELMRKWEPNPGDLCNSIKDQIYKLQA